MPFPVGAVDQGIGFIITADLLAFKAVMLVEPSPVVLALELLVAMVGVTLNLYYLVRG